jgi:hypothetical protein
MPKPVQEEIVTRLTAASRPARYADCLWIWKISVQYQRTDQQRNFYPPGVTVSYYKSRRGVGSLTDLVLALEHVQPPVVARLPRLGRLVVLECHSGCVRVGLGSERAV